MDAHLEVVDHSLLGVYILGGVCFLLLLFRLSRWLAPRGGGQSASEMPYECGELPEGPALRYFSLRYYVFALVFVLFEVELLFLLPWAVVMGDIRADEGVVWAWVAFAEMSIFVALLLLGWVYAWRRGDLRAISPRPRPLRLGTRVPAQMYDDLNERYERRATV